MMKHVFLDTNVVIDFLASRQPFALDAAKLFDYAVEGEIVLYVSAVSYNNIYYVLRQSLSNNQTNNLLQELTSIIEIADVTSEIIKQSLKTDFKDFEDAIQYYCAKSISKIDFIVTRNTKDFRKSQLSVLTPAEAVNALAL